MVLVVLVMMKTIQIMGVVVVMTEMEGIVVRLVVIMDYCDYITEVMVMVVVVMM